MYNIEDKFLYEVLEDYQDTQSENEKHDIFQAFMKTIWSSSNTRRVYKKDFTFSIPAKLLRTDIGQIFYTHSSITFLSYKSKSSDKDYISLVRQKINNMYTLLCDERVCIAHEYMDAIKYSKQLYHRFLKDPSSFDRSSLTKLLDDNIENLPIIKKKYTNRKLHLTWSEYQVLIETYLQRCFFNYKPISENDSGQDFLLDIDFITEDNYCIRYLCKSLAGYMRNFQKEYYSIHRNRTMNLTYCNCGSLFDKRSNRQTHCPACQKEITKMKTRLRVAKYRNTSCNDLENPLKPL